MYWVFIHMSLKKVWMRGYMFSYNHVLSRGEKWDELGLYKFGYVPAHGGWHLLRCGEMGEILLFNKPWYMCPYMGLHPLGCSATCAFPDAIRGHMEIGAHMVPTQSDHYKGLGTWPQGNSFLVPSHTCSKMILQHILLSFQWQAKMVFMSIYICLTAPVLLLWKHLLLQVQ